MQEIRTSGSMSGDGKRSVAAWPKLPRPSSTLPKRPKAYGVACPQLAKADAALLMPRSFSFGVADCDPVF
jgi:hypothetical protein